MSENMSWNIWDRAKNGSFRVVLGHLKDDQRLHAVGMRVKGHSGQVQVLPPIFFNSKNRDGRINVDAIHAAGHRVVSTHGLPRIVCTDGTIIPLKITGGVSILWIEVSDCGQGF
jgi:hypothetical protein